MKSFRDWQSKHSELDMLVKASLAAIVYWIWSLVIDGHKFFERLGTEILFGVIAAVALYIILRWRRARQK